MIHIRNITDCHHIIDKPELYREVTSYLLYCLYEIQYAGTSFEDDIGVFGGRHYLIAQLHNFQ
ncbi:MAG: hypothetical protein V2I50_05470 [Desulfuromusa sp.]|jgi:hypothetical protein|nr:hypothetical protein [Desulfuromusa sp.]